MNLKIDYSSLDLQLGNIMSIDWDKTNLQELDITGTELSSDCLIHVLTR